MSRDYIHEREIEDPARKRERASRNRARRALEKVVGPLGAKQVEHKNGRATDNRLSNLRAVTAKQNNNGRAGGPAGRK